MEWASNPDVTRREKRYVCLETHVADARIIFVTDDAKAFISYDRREKLQSAY
jgi:hypothetical protein